jgi:hypothetical protein
MIVKIGKPGKSFVKLALYLGHDVKADSSERLAWAYTRNCAHDHVPSAVHEMFTTWHNAEFLKREAGIRADGGKMEKPVKHISLSWDPSQTLTREAMIDAVDKYLRHMGWQDHQAVLFAHTDKKYQHVHIMLSAVNPETGLRLDERYERDRTRNWAAAYELECGKVFCPERLKPFGERAKSAPRPIWDRLRGIDAEGLEPIFVEEQGTEQHCPPGWKGEEWRHLRKLQEEQRRAFFDHGKEIYRQVRNQIYQEIRVTYRGEWGEFYALKHAGAAPEVLSAFRANLVSQQNATLDYYRDAAIKELRTKRDMVYRALLDGQIAEREILSQRQARGFSSSQLWKAQEAARLRAEAAKSSAPTKESTPPAARPAPDAHRAAWTQRAGMAAQQRSAVGWGTAGSYVPPVASPSPPTPMLSPIPVAPPLAAGPPEPRSWHALVAKFTARVRKRPPGQQRQPAKPVGVEPDI